MGAGLQYIDIGGGLGVDYDGSATNYESSMNYTLNEYASDVVYRIKAVCDERDVAHPMIVSESGRAIAAHHSLLVFNTLGASSSTSSRSPATSRNYRRESAAAGPRPVRQLPLGQRAPAGRVYHDAMQAREQALQMFNLGLPVARVPRPGRAAVLGDLHPDPRLCRAGQAPRGTRGPRVDAQRHLFLQLLDLPVAARQLGDRSPVPDHADTAARRRARRATRYWPTSPATRTARSTASSVRARPSARSRCTNWSPARSTTSAAFLVGAYQETLGDLHNLFGDTHVVHIRLHDEGGWWIEEIVKGDTATRVLEYMEYDTDELYPGSPATANGRCAKGA